MDSYTVTFSTFSKDTSVVMTFLQDDNPFLEFEVDNDLFVEDWEYFIEHIRHTDDQLYFLDLQKHDNSRVKFVSFKNTFEINMYTCDRSTRTMRIRLIKNESLFKAFEDLMLVLKSLDDVEFSDEE